MTAGQTLKRLILTTVLAGSLISLGSLFVPASAFAAGKCLTNGSIAVNRIEPCLADKSEFPWIVDAWRWSLSIVNSLAVLVLIIMAFANILYPISFLEPYRIRQLLPTFIWGIILANASIFIVRAVVSLGDILMSDSAITITALYDAWGIKASEMEKTGIMNAVNFGKDSQTTEIGGMIYKLVTSTILVYLPVIAMACLAFVFYMRFAIIFVCAAVSPLAFGSIIFPATKSFLGKWWDWLWKWTFGGVASYLILSFAAQIKPAGTQGASTLIDIIPYGIAIGLVYLAIVTPFKLGGAIGSWWQGVGKTGWRRGTALTKFAGGKAVQGTRFALGLRKGGWMYNNARQAFANSGISKLYTRYLKLPRQIMDEKYETTEKTNLQEGAYKNLQGHERKKRSMKEKFDKQYGAGTAKADDEYKQWVKKYDAANGLEIRKLKGIVRSPVHEDATALYQYATADEVMGKLEEKATERGLTSVADLYQAAKNGELEHKDWKEFATAVRGLQTLSKSNVKLTDAAGNYIQAKDAAGVPLTDSKGNEIWDTEGRRASMAMQTIDPSLKAGTDVTKLSFAHQAQPILVEPVGGASEFGEQAGAAGGPAGAAEGTGAATPSTPTISAQATETAEAAHAAATPAAPAAGASEAAAAGGGNAGAQVDSGAIREETASAAAAGIAEGIERGAQTAGQSAFAGVAEGISMQHFDINAGVTRESQTAIGQSLQEAIEGQELMANVGAQLDEASAGETAAALQTTMDSNQAAVAVKASGDATDAIGDIQSQLDNHNFSGDVHLNTGAAEAGLDQLGAKNQTVVKKMLQDMQGFENRVRTNVNRRLQNQKRLNTFQAKTMKAFRTQVFKTPAAGPAAPELPPSPPPGA